MKNVNINQSEQLEIINSEIDTLFYKSPIPYLIMEHNYLSVKCNNSFNSIFEFENNKPLKQILEFGAYLKFLSWMKNSKYKNDSLILNMETKCGKKSFQISCSEFPYENSYMNKLFLLTFIDVDYKYKLINSLEEEENRYKTLLDIGSDGIHILNLDGDLIEFNNAFVELLGYNSKDEIKNLNLKDWEASIEVSQLKDFLKQIKLEPKIFETKHRKKDGTIIDVEINAKAVTFENETFIYCSARDLSEQLKALKYLEKLIDLQDNIVIITDSKQLKFANAKFSQFFGYENLDHFKEYFDCICELFVEYDKFFHMGKLKDTQNWIDFLQTIPQSKRVVAMAKYDMTLHAFKVSINRFEDDLYVVSFTDITQTVLGYVELERKTIHDRLTNAYNREYFYLNINTFIENSNFLDNNLAIAILDIDHFKIVNDNFGHDVGDMVLIHFVNIIEKYSRKNDILIRWGGEEFVLLLNVQSEEDLLIALNNLKSLISEEKFPLVGNKTCSIGATLYKENESIETTIKRADEALYAAKNSGRNRVEIHL